MTEVGKRWLIFGVVALAGLLIALVVVANNSDKDPRPFIQKTYDRSAELDESDGGQAYVSPRSPADVADEIHDNARSVDRKAGEGAEFLQYRDDIVAVTPHEGGSKIYVDDYRTAHNRYSGHSTYGFIFLGGGGWSSTPPSGGFRGGGSGFGK
ncbi:MAG: DUF4247 domain-containing protein [Stackebrandtia sp.]